MDPQDLFVQNLELIDRVLTITARRQGSSPDEVEEFRSWARLRLIDNDYRALRRFEGRCKLSSFLAVVAGNLFRDWRIARWGKWRPSVAARRLGTVAVRVETLVVRDGHSLTDATRMLQINEGLELSEQELTDVVRQLPTRFRRRIEGEEGLERVAVPPRADDTARDNEREDAAERLESGLGHALRDMAEEDRVILRLRYEEGISVADIARMLDLDQKSLYRQCDRLLARLREAILEQDLDFEQIEDLLGWDRLEFSLESIAGAGESGARPSHQPEAL